MAASTLARTRPETAERILEAAFDCIGDIGLSRMTMEDVARRAGCTRQTVYRYFPSKDHLVMALVVREEDRFIEETRRAFSAALAVKSLSDCSFRTCCRSSLRAAAIRSTRASFIVPSISL